MNKIILCEGSDDLTFIGYYLYKTSNGQKWKYSPNTLISDNFKKFPFVNELREKVSIYTRNQDKLALWGVGGKDAFEHAIKYIKEINYRYPQERYEEVVIISDRDDNEIQEVISQFSEIFSRLFWSLALENNSRNIFEYTVDEIKYNFTITPIIIPFEAKGTIETLLMDAMAENSAEDNMVVESAQSYIERLISARNLKKYLQHQRLIPKAKFSTVLSVINPEKSTDTMNTILIQYDWESKAEIRRHFRLLEYL